MNGQSKTLFHHIEHSSCYSGISSLSTSKQETIFFSVKLIWKYSNRDLCSDLEEEQDNFECFIILEVTEKFKINPDWNISEDKTQSQRIIVATLLIESSSWGSQYSRRANLSMILKRCFLSTTNISYTLHTVMTTVQTSSSEQLCVVELLLWFSSSHCWHHSSTISPGVKNLKMTLVTMFC